MKIYKEIQRTCKSTYLDKTFCDICKLEIKNNDSRTMDDIIIESELGNDYGEYGGDKEVLSFDLCRKCGNDKLVPGFKDQGANPQSENVNG